MNDFMSIEMLASFAGLVAATTLIVQFTKSIVKKQFGDRYVRLYAFLIALILTFIFARGESTLEGIVLTLVNTIIVSITAIGSYEVLADPKAEKKRL